MLFDALHCIVRYYAVLYYAVLQCISVVQYSTVQCHSDNTVIFLLYFAKIEVDSVVLFCFVIFNCFASRNGPCISFLGFCCIEIHFILFNIIFPSQ